jgi:hypothetical protein
VINQRSVPEAGGYRVRDVLRISAPGLEAEVVRVTIGTVFVRWPWLAVDPQLPHRWDGTVGFPRDPEAYDWRNEPWHLEPGVTELSTGSFCRINMPETYVRVREIVCYDPPAAFGWLPRPEVALGVQLLDFEDDAESGFTLYLESGEPIDIETVSRGS